MEVDVVDTRRYRSSCVRHHLSVRADGADATRHDRVRAHVRVAVMCGTVSMSVNTAELLPRMGKECTDPSDLSA